MIFFYEKDIKKQTPEKYNKNIKFINDFMNFLQLLMKNPLLVKLPNYAFKAVREAVNAKTNFNIGSLRSVWGLILELVCLYL